MSLEEIKTRIKNKLDEETKIANLLLFETFIDDLRKGVEDIAEKYKEVYKNA